MSSDALKPDPVTELPLTPPAEEDDEEAAAIWPGVLDQHEAAFPVWGGKKKKDCPIHK